MFKDKICVYVTIPIASRNQNLKVFPGIRIIGGNLKSEFKKDLTFLIAAEINVLCTLCKSTQTTNARYQFLQNRSN